MASKLTYTALTISTSLEIKMRTILSFYEDLATSIAYKSNPDCFEIIAIEQTSQHTNAASNTTSRIFENVVDFIKPMHRSSDIVNYLIEREQRSLLNLT